MLARGFSDAAILDAGRTGAFTGAAEQAEINMFLESVAQLDASIGGGFDQMDSAARRFRFEAGGAIGRTLIQAQATVDALIEFGEIQRRDLWMIAVVVFMFDVFQISDPQSLLFCHPELKAKDLLYSAATKYFRLGSGTETHSKAPQNDMHR